MEIGKKGRGIRRKVKITKKKKGKKMRVKKMEDGSKETKRKEEE